MPEIDWGTKPFLCLDVWTTNNKFKPLIEEEWTKLGNFSIDHKLKYLKAPIRVWNKKTFGMIGENMKSLEVEIHKLDTNADDHCFTTKEWARMKALRDELKKWSVKKGQLAIL